jgi:TfoX C-terminal domain
MTRPLFSKRATRSVSPNVLALALLPSLGTFALRCGSTSGIKTGRRCAPWGRKPAFARCAFTSDGGCRSNFIYALECAIRGIAWKMLKPVRKAALLEAARRIILELES